jgi:hypothetical protein
MPDADVADLLDRVASLETQPDIAFIARALRTAGSGSRGANGHGNRNDPNGGE